MGERIDGERTGGKAAVRLQRAYMPFQRGVSARALKSPWSFFSEPRGLGSRVTGPPLLLLSLFMAGDITDAVFVVAHHSAPLSSAPLRRRVAPLPGFSLFSHWV